MGSPVLACSLLNLLPNLKNILSHSLPHRFWINSRGNAT